MLFENVYRNRIRLFRKIAFSCLLLCLLSCQSDSSTTPEATSEPNPLEALITEIDKGTYGEIHSVLISRNDTLILEKYFHGYNRDQLHRLYSVTKSVTSAMIGIALDRGEVPSLHNRLLDFFSDYPNIANMDSQKNIITIENLLTMSAGFSWDETSTSYNSDENDAFKLGRSGDWMKYMLDLPMQSVPGQQFVYNSGCTMLLSGLIFNTTGNNAETFAQSHIFEFLGISNWNWRTGPNEITNTGWGLDLSPRDMLLFGKLYLNNGTYRGIQIIPQNWIVESTQTKISAGADHNYAYQWWRFSDTSNIGRVLKTNDLFFAWGYGGQFIFVIPHLNTIVVSTAGNFRSSTVAFDFLEKYILPAVQLD